MFIYSLQTTIKFSLDSLRPNSLVCFYTKQADLLEIPLKTIRPVIFLFCEVPFNEVTDEFTTEAIHAVLDHVIELREKAINECIWLTTDDKSSRIGFKKSGERSLENYDFSLNIWRKEDSHMANPSLEVNLKNCPILRFTKKLQII